MTGSSATCTAASRLGVWTLLRVINLAPVRRAWHDRNGSADDVDSRSNAAGVINGLANALGLYRNFECKDAATNIMPWGILIGGEELQQQ